MLSSPIASSACTHGLGGLLPTSSSPYFALSCQFGTISPSYHSSIKSGSFLSSFFPGWWHLQICYQYFPFYFPSHLENESWVLFPASSPPKPLGKLLTLFPCSVRGKKSSGMWQTSRPCGTEPPGELPTWEELSGEPQVLSLQHLTPAPSFLWALYSTDWAAATHLFWYKLQALVCFIPWHKSLKH